MSNKEHVVEVERSTSNPTPLGTTLLGIIWTCPCVESNKIFILNVYPTQQKIQIRPFKKYPAHICSVSSQRSFSTHALLNYLNIFQMGMNRNVTHLISYNFK